MRQHQRCLSLSQSQYLHGSVIGSVGNAVGHKGRRDRGGVAAVGKMVSSTQHRRTVGRTHVGSCSLMNRVVLSDRRSRNTQPHSCSLGTPCTRHRCLVLVHSTSVESWCSASGCQFGFENNEEDGMYVVSSGGCAKGSVLASLPGKIAVTLTDVENDVELRGLADGRGELVSLALFLMKHRWLGEDSCWSELVSSFPEQVDTPVLWNDEERIRLLNGSPVLKEARKREQVLQDEWESLEIKTVELCAVWDTQDVKSWMTRENFFKAMSVVLGCAVYLPSAQCFALVPVLGNLPKTGSEGGAMIDYDAESDSVVLTSSLTMSDGDVVKVFDGRPNGELFLATGTAERGNPVDFLTLETSLVAADRLYSMKKEIVESMGFSASMEFPIYEDRLATQHLAYLRLARLTDPAQFAKVSFEDDVIISQENEYEILQLVMADVREWLQRYDTGMEDDVKELQRKDLSTRERMAATLRLGEKRVLQGTMNGVRRRLAPIRGIPTKSGGLEDPNADLVEIFETIENLPSAPKRLLDGLTSWARGDNDPDWKR